MEKNYLISFGTAFVVGLILGGLAMARYTEVNTMRVVYKEQIGICQGTIKSEMAIINTVKYTEPAPKIKKP